MLNTWWIDLDGVLAGGIPTDGDLADLRGTGFAVLISLIDERHEPLKYDVAKAIAAGWTRHKIEIPQSGTPSIEQLQEFVRLMGTAPPEVKILIHCGTGVGRAATMGAAYWIGRGLPVAQSIERIRAAKGDEWLTEDRRTVLEEFGNRVNSGRIKTIEMRSVELSRGTDPLG